MNQAGGRIGGAFADELLKTGRHTVTALIRKGSTSTPPKEINTVDVDYDDDDSLVSALRGQQFLIITLSVSVPNDLHGRIVKAAGKAGVPYVMPNLFGGDIENKTFLEGSIIGDLYKARLDDFGNSGTAYVVLVCGFWYEWSLGLPEPWFGFDIRKRTLTLFDDGKTPINVSTWLQCGRAIAALLSLPESGASPCVADWKNKPLYVSSFKVSQRDMLESLHRVLGTTDGDWTISYEPSDKRYKRGMDELQNGIQTGFPTALYARNFYPNGGGDYESTHGLDNSRLGLPVENLDEATQRTVEMVEDGFVESVFRNLA
jgi:hypothetical protein